MMKSKNGLVGIALLLLGILLSAGATWLFPTCGPMQDGSWMKCHWSGQMTIGIGIVITALAIAYLLLPQKYVRAGLSISVVAIALLDLAVLNGLIGLCEKATMQCRAVTKPAATIISGIVIVLGVADAIWLLRKENGKNPGAQ